MVEFSVWDWSLNILVHVILMVEAWRLIPKISVNFYFGKISVHIDLRSWRDHVSMLIELLDQIFSCFNWSW